MEFLPVNSESLLHAAQVIKSGGIVAFPTETVYGLGANAYDSAAVVKIFEAKNRPFFDPLIIHIANVNTLNEAADLSALSEDSKLKLSILIKNFFPGPLSVVLPKNNKIPGIVTAGLSTAAFRFPANEAAQKLISLSCGAVAAPSANPFGTLSPTRAEHVRDSLGGKIDIILDGGKSLVGVESTVLDLTGNGAVILRHGGTPKEEIEKSIGAVGEFLGTEDNAKDNPASPGQLKSHYAPKTQLSVFGREEIIRLPYKKDCAFLFFDESSHNVWRSSQDELIEIAAVKILSPAGNLQEAAACLFETLHELDSFGFTQVYAQSVPQQGLGAAINDRLKRMSYNLHEVV